MKIEQFGKDYNISDSLRAITEKKCKKLEKYFADDADAIVKISVTLQSGTYTTVITVISRALEYRAEAASQTPFDNIDIVIPRLEGQIRKQKDIWGKARKGSANVYDESDGSETKK